MVAQVTVEDDTTEEIEQQEFRKHQIKLAQQEKDFNLTGFPQNSG